ncbi:MAG: hypothetical protein ACSHX6_13970 [Akkermansiaceae bacterium]
MKINKLIIVGLSALLVTATSAVAQEKGKDKGKDRPPRKTFEELDADKDGKISEAEFVAGAKDAERAAKHFAKKDKDEDGFLSEEEFAKGGREKGKGKGKGKGPKKEKAE